MDLSIISQILSSTTTHAASMAPRLVDAGLWLLTGLGVIAVSWKLAVGVLSEKDARGLLVDVVTPGIVIGFLAWLIRDLGPISKTFLDGIDWIAATLTQTSPDGGILAAALAAQAKLASSVWEIVSADSPSWWDWLTNTSAGIGALVMRLLSVGLMMIAMAVTAGVFVMSQVLAGIAIALGPVFLPFFVIKQLSFIANGWIRFLFVAGFMKVIGVVMLSFAAAMGNDINTLAAAVGADQTAEFNLSAGVAMLAVSFIMLILAFQIPSIANGLVSGHVGAVLSAEPVTKMARGANAAGKSAAGVPPRPPGPKK